MKIKGQICKDIEITDVYNKLKTIQRDRPKGKKTREKAKVMIMKEKRSGSYISSKHISSMPSLKRPYRMPSSIGHKKKDPELFKKMPTNWHERKPSLSSVISGGTNKVLEAIEEISKTVTNKESSVSSVRSRFSRKKTEFIQIGTFRKKTDKDLARLKKLDSILASGDRKVTEKEKKLGTYRGSTDNSLQGKLEYRKIAKGRDSRIPSSESHVWNHILQNQNAKRADIMKKRRRTVICKSVGGFRKAGSSAYLSKINQVGL